MDIGAFHERWNSNTHAISRLGLSDVAVDVDKAKLLSFGMRRNCKVRVGAVVPNGLTDDFVKIYKLGRMSSEYVTINKATADDYVVRHGLAYEKVSVQAIPIDRLLDDMSRIYGKKTSYLNIYIEGRMRKFY